MRYLTVPGVQTCALPISPRPARRALADREAWQALLVNLTGFGLATAVRVSQGTPGWAWSAFAGETLVLVLVSAALVPTLARFVTRLQAARSTLAQVERGDLTVQLQDEELDELGYLGASVNRTTGAIAGVVRQVQHQSQDLRSEEHTSELQSQSNLVCRLL